MPDAEQGRCLKQPLRELSALFTAIAVFKLKASLAQAIILWRCWSFSHSAGISAAGTGGLNR